MQIRRRRRRAISCSIDRKSSSSSFLPRYDWASYSHDARGGGAAGARATFTSLRFDFVKLPLRHLQGLYRILLRGGSQVGSVHILFCCDTDCLLASRVDSHLKLCCNHTNLPLSGDPSVPPDSACMHGFFLEGSSRSVAVATLSLDGRLSALLRSPCCLFRFLRSSSYVCSYSSD